MTQENDKYFLERQKGFLDIYEKEGPTGKCPPLTPIYILYADYLSTY